MKNDLFFRHEQKITKKFQSSHFENPNFQKIQKKSSLQKLILSKILSKIRKISHFNQLCSPPKSEKFGEGKWHEFFFVHTL